MLFIPRDTFWRDNARYPQKINVQPLDRPKNFSTTTKNSRSAKNFSTGKKFSTDKKNSRPVKKFSSGKKILDRQKNFSTVQKILDRLKTSREEISQRNLEKKSRKINMNSQRVDLHLAWWNDIWACYLKNNLDHFCPLWLPISPRLICRIVCLGLNLIEL